MDCKLTSLQDELLKYLPEGNDAQEQYNALFSNEFKEWYGDWQAPDFDRNYLNEEGEPLLHKGGIFYSALDKTHIPIVGDVYDSFTAGEVEDVVGKLAYEVVKSGKILDFAGDLTGETANIGKIINDFIISQVNTAESNRDKYPKGSKEWEKYNDEREGLDLINDYKAEFKEKVLDFLESRGVKTKSKKTEELEQEVVDELETLESEALEAVESDGLNLTESFRKNSKDNATANIKLLLSFLPKIEITEDNKFVYEKSSYLNGTSFEDFNHVFNKLQDELSNLVTLNGENGKVLDMFDLMLEKVGDLSATMPVMAVLKERLRELPEYKKTEFVQTFSMSKYDFITTLVSGKEGNRVVKVGTAQQFSASDIIIDAWNVGFEETSSINISTGKFNSSLINKQLESLNKIKKDLESKKIDSVKLKGAIEDRILEAFESIGVTPNKKAFMAYMGADSAGNIETGEFKNKFTSILNAFIRLSNITDENIYDEDRNMNNVLKDVMGNVLKDLAKEQAKFEPSLTDATVLGKDGNQFWEYSKPSMMHSLLSQIHRGDYSLLDELLGQPYAKGSRWLNHIDGLRRQGKTEAIKNIKISTFLQFKEEGKGDQGEDSKSISMPDLLADTINKTLNHRKNNPKEGIRNHNSINSTMTAADKSQQHHMEGMPAIKSNISGNPSDVKFYNKEVVETFKDYLRDELRRYAKAYKELDTLPKEKLILYYHTDKDGNVRDEDSLLGNAFNIYSFPGILEAVPGILNSAKEVITDSQGEPLLPDAVDAYVKKALSDKIVETYNAAKKYHIVKEDGSNNAIDKTILASYSGSHKTFAAIADFTINSLVSNIEGTKMFNGDPGFYKNPADFLKRIPASYINGLTLRLGIKDAEGKFLKDNDHEFKVAVLAAVETNPSAYLDSITKAFEDAGYSKEDIDDLKKAYVGVNVTDAQGYITPDRFKFLMERLGKGTTPEWNRIYEKATTKVDGKWQQLTPEEFKTLSAQPLKGVYFGQKNGMPTYLKYSQAVLWPSFVEGSALENLKNKMETEKVDEAVVTDGIKVGLVQPQTVHDAENNLRLPDIPLNTITLDNRNWRLQQDLPNKGIKQTLLGSQLQKNILANISLDKEYGDMLGQDIVDDLNKTIAELSNRGVEEVLENFKVDKDGNVDRSILDEVIIKELKEKGGADNLIKAIERGVQYDALFQHRDKIQNILFSHINKRVIDIATNGGSFIQMAPFGITEKLADYAGVKWLVEKSELKPPLKNKDGSISRGQVLIPHNQIVKHIPNYRNMSLEDLNAAIDPEALKLIGYRIPNQGMSSNDALEVAGILPPEMGDMVVAYGEITAKTGSDYDIDKMYMMIPHIELVNGVVKRVEYDESLNEEKSEDSEDITIDKNSKQALQNKLITLYDKVLTDPKTYAALMSSIDAEFMKDDIKSLLPNEGKSDLDLFDSIKQLELKIDLMSGKAGVGQTANQLTDHALTQIADFKLNEYLGVGLTDEKGHTVFNQVKSEKVPGRDPKDITVVMSAFLNAYVDIAKDPYVVQGNHNTFTANTVFMLLRAGVDYQWVNAFIAQPILKDLVNETFNGKGRMALKQKGPQGGYLSALEVIKKKWEEKVGKDYEHKESYNKISSTFKDVSPLEYLKDTAKSPNSADPRYQLDVLTMFEGWKNISKSLRDSVIASKNDVNGAGYDLISKQIIENTKEQVLNDSRLTNFSNKFKMNGKNTALGTFYDNSVGLANLITNNMFITDSIGFRRILNEFSIELGQGVLTNRDLGKKLEKEIFAYLYSQTDLQMQDESIIPMFRGKNSVANNVSRLKEHKRYKNNPLIKHLQIKKGHKKDGYSYVTISNTKNQPKYFKDLLYKGWLELLEDPELRPFAEKLVRYSYYSSGFKKGIGSIFEHIPNEWIFGNGINDRMKAWKNILNNDEVLEDLKVQVYKHMWADNTIVPSVSKHVPKKLPKNISANNAGHGTDIIFTIPEFVGKYKKNDQWPRFVTRKIGSTDYLYRLAGTVENDNEKKTEHAVYVRTNKLGYSKKGKTIVEYGSDSKNSIFPENIAIKESKVYNEFRKNLRFVYNIVTPPKTVVPEMSVVEPFVIDHQEMLNKAEARKKNCK